MRRAPLACLAVSLLALSTGVPALAAEAPPSTPSLLEAMVASGVITQAQADKILADARARDAAKAVAASQSAPAAQAAQAAPANDGAVHVQYVPEVVKKQLRDEIKQEVMSQAKSEGWAAPNQTPEWTQRITVSGDVRGRFEDDLYPHGNSPGAAETINFNALNTASTPVNLTNIGSGSSIIPYNNANEDRQRERLRARLAVDADIGDGFFTGMRFATGADSSPVSTNQTVGSSGGNFSKYALWLDRAFIKYEPWKSMDSGLTASLGRFANPFFSTDLIWNNDLNFDGLAVTGDYQVTEGVTPFVTAGAFPVFNTDLNFASTDTTKTASNNKWLYGLQAGTDWKADKDTAVKVGAAYYYFQNVEGKQADCYYTDTTCASDLSRPTFAQKGNTYFDLRRNYGGTGASTDPNYQYFGLATPFHDLALTGRLDYDGLQPLEGHPLRLSLDGEYVKNLAFNKSSIQAKNPENNCAGTVTTSSSASSSSSSTCTFDGGDSGYMARLTAGSPALAQRWDWNVSVAYKYIESDAVVDGLNDSDFGLGGTNLKGYILGGNLALTKNVWTNLRWMSADSIGGTPFSVDILMLDLNAKF